MKIIVSLLLLSGVVMCQKQSLNTTRVTSIGTWGEMERCPEGKFVTGFQIKYHIQRGRGDNTALNGVRLYCNSLNGKPSTNTMITSTVGKNGDWQAVKWCHAGLVVTGYALLDTAYTTKEDNVGVVNYAAYSGYPFGPRNQAKWKKGVNDKMPGLRWLKDRFCPKGYAVCGLQSSIDEDRGNQKSPDFQGLTNTNAECCKVPEEEITCENPTISKRRVATFENVHAGQVSATYTVKHSFGYVFDTLNQPCSSETDKIAPKILAAAAKLAADFNTAIGRIRSKQLKLP